MTSKQRAYLKGLAMELDPVTQIGKDGVTEAFLESAAAAIEKRELIKLAALQTSPVSAKDASGEIARVIGAEVVQVIGNRIVLYKKNQKKPKIVLPR